MGIMLWVAGFVVLAALYIPGFLLVRGCGVSRVAAALCAPMVMVGLYVLIGMGLRQAAVFATGPVMLGCGLALAAVVYGIGRMARRGSRRNSFQAAALPCEETASEVIGRAEGLGRRLVRTLRRGGDWSLLALYLVLGVAVTAFMTASCLASPESIVQEYDNVHHLGVAQAFLQSGVWSPFAANLYSAPDAAAFNPLPLGGFYPTAWSMMTAFVASLMGCSVALAANAVNCAIAAVLYPTSLFFLVRVLFPRRGDVVAAGSVVMLASTQFPWALMIFGPLYPNMLAYALMPAVAACFVCWLGPVRAAACDAPPSGSVPRPAAHVRWFLLLLTGLVTSVFAQPNAVFSLGVFLVPFIVAKAYGHGRRTARAPRSSRAARRRGLAWATCACALIALAWFAVFSVPIIQAVASFAWPATKTAAQAAREVGLFMFRFGSLNVLLTLFLWVGALWTLKHRRWLWVTCSFALFGVLYAVAQTVDGPMKALLTGFWYTDSLRIAAAAVIFAMPLAAIGFAATTRWLADLLGHLLHRERPGRAERPSCALRTAVGAALAVVLLVTSFLVSVPANLGPLQKLGPDDEWFEPTTGMGAVVGSLSEMTDGTRTPKLSDDERAFIERVRQIVPADSPIANVPFDGSAWAYGALGLNDYYRYIGTYGVEGETPESRLVRMHLREYADNPDVRDAVDKLGIRYVLQLDQGGRTPTSKDTAFLHAEGDGFNWRGLTGIDDDTPGFTPVLSEGDMRLYEIG